MYHRYCSAPLNFNLASNSIIFFTIRQGCNHHERQQSQSILAFIILVFCFPHLFDLKINSYSIKLMTLSQQRINVSEDLEQKASCFNQKLSISSQNYQIIETICEVKLMNEEDELELKILLYMGVDGSMVGHLPLIIELLSLKTRCQSQNYNQSQIRAKDSSIKGFQSECVCGIEKLKLKLQNQRL